MKNKRMYMKNLIYKIIELVNFVGIISIFVVSIILELNKIFVS
jgi:hypothetical protein